MLLASAGWLLTQVLMLIWSVVERGWSVVVEKGGSVVVEKGGLVVVERGGLVVWIMLPLPLPGISLHPFSFCHGSADSSSFAV